MTYSDLLHCSKEPNSQMEVSSLKETLSLGINAMLVIPNLSVHWRRRVIVTHFDYVALCGQQQLLPVSSSFADIKDTADTP